MAGILSTSRTIEGGHRKLWRMAQRRREKTRAGINLAWSHSSTQGIQRYVFTACACARTHAHIFGLTDLSIPMMLHAVSIQMRFQLVRPEVDAV